MSLTVSDHQSVLNAWNAMAIRTGLPRVRLMTTQRRVALALRLKDIGLEGMFEAIGAVEQSAFCCGDNERGWRANLDFVLQPKSLARLLEGVYAGRPRDPHTESVNGAALLLARMDAEMPTIDGSVINAETHQTSGHALVAGTHGSAGPPVGDGCATERRNRYARLYGPV